MKNKKRDAYKEIDHLLPGIKPTEIRMKDRDVKLFDMDNLVGWDNLEKDFRAVVSDEEWYEWELNPERKKVKVLKTSHWRWLTNMPTVYKSQTIYRFGHGRWEEEERGFNDVAINCNFDHPYHHHPTALLAMLWIIAITFNLSYAFYSRNLKPEIRERQINSRTQLVVTIIETFIMSKESIFFHHLNQQVPP